MISHNVQRDLMSQPPTSSHRIQLAGPTADNRIELPTQRTLPGLSYEDDCLAHAYLDRLPNRFKQCHANIAIGTVAKPPDHEPDAFELKQLTHQWAKRIDLATLHGDLWNLIECKPRADHKAIGQILCYQFWWHQTPQLSNNTRPLIVCQRSDDDVLAAARHFHIEILTLPNAIET